MSIDREAVVTQLLSEAARLHELAARDSAAAVVAAADMMKQAFDGVAVGEVARPEDDCVYRRRSRRRRGGVHVRVPYDVIPRVQEVHRTLIHAVCELTESQI